MRTVGWHVWRGTAEWEAALRNVLSPSSLYVAKRGGWFRRWRVVRVR